MGFYLDGIAHHRAHRSFMYVYLVLAFQGPDADRKSAKAFHLCFLNVKPPGFGINSTAIRIQ